MRIDAMSGIGNTMLSRSTQAAGGASGFEDLLRQSVGDVNQLQINAENVMEAVAAGQEINPALAATAVIKADLAFRTMIQIRNKLTQAFQEIRQMQI